jgi:steroid delta-isomerase-like uncharacterized protein
MDDDKEKYWRWLEEMWDVQKFDVQGSIEREEKRKEEVLEIFEDLDEIAGRGAEAPYFRLDGSSLTSEENKAIVRRYFEEVWNEGDLNVVDELFTTNFVRYGPASIEGVVRGSEGFKRLVGMYRAAFPDLQIPIEDQIAEGDMVVSRWIASGTHRGEFRGIVPTGTRVEVAGITIDRVPGGKVEETWTNYDTLGMLRQIGAIPQPGSAPHEGGISS